MPAQLCRSGLERREIPGRFSYANIHPTADQVISANPGFSPSSTGSCAVTKGVCSFAGTLFLMLKVMHSWGWL